MATSCEHLPRFTPLPGLPTYVPSIPLLPPIPFNRTAGFCLLFSRFGTNKAKLNCIGIDISYPTFLPSFPHPGFANQSFPATFCYLRYYEGSDSCNPSPGLAGLPIYCDLPSCRSTSNHVMCPYIAFTATAACTMIFRLHPNVGGSPAHPAESSSSSCGPTVRFRLLPTPPHGDAVAFSYGTVAMHRHGLTPC